ncbi:MAG: hypothetical protein JZU65_24590, partial [Chlorobium sp.]|nr:hypothetical protein [Chlorobium sp.]
MTIKIGSPLINGRLCVSLNTILLSAQSPSKGGVLAAFLAATLSLLILSAVLLPAGILTPVKLSTNAPLGP